jgi:hypothetical protein
VLNVHTLDQSGHSDLLFITHVLSSRKSKK